MQLLAGKYLGYSCEINLPETDSWTTSTKKTKLKQKTQSKNHSSDLKSQPAFRSTHLKQEEESQVAKKPQTKKPKKNQNKE